MSRPALVHSVHTRCTSTGNRVVCVRVMLAVDEHTARSLEQASTGWHTAVHHHLKDEMRKAHDQ